MSESLWNIGFTISLILTIIPCIWITRNISRSGVEQFGSRILIISGIINVILCVLFISGQSAIEIIKLLSADTVQFHFLLIPVIFALFPIRILWNYLFIQHRPISQFKLIDCDNKNFLAITSQLSHIMGIQSPKILTSSLVSSPFIFGHRSRKAFLAIPEDWIDIHTQDQHIQLLHELSHVRNHDVGFLAWAAALLKDITILFVLIPALTLYCLIVDYTAIISSLWIYFICFSFLFILLKYVIRQRESLADLTTTLLMESSQIKKVIDSQDIKSSFLTTKATPAKRPGLFQNLQRYLFDKAMFSKRPTIWKLLFRLQIFLTSQHPSPLQRIKTISQEDLTSKLKLSLQDSIWAGMTIGLMGLIVGISGLWYTTSYLFFHDEIKYLEFPFKLLGLVAPFAIGYMALFLSLPVWASLKLPTVSNRFILHLLNRYSIAFISAAGLCLLALMLNAITNHQGLILMIIILVWLGFITIFGFLVNTVIMILWITTRYLQKSHLIELGRSIGRFSIFIITTSALIVCGFMMISNNHVLNGTILITSTIAGGAIVSRAVRGSRYSENDKSLISCFLIPLFHIEGKWYSISTWLIEPLIMTVTLLIITSLIYLPISFFLNRYSTSINSTFILLIASFACIAVLVLLERKGAKITESKRSKICILHHCHKLLSIPLDDKTIRKLEIIIKSYDLEWEKHNKSFANLTMHDAYEINSFSQTIPESRQIQNKLSKWVLQCQNSQGFGIWLGSSPRLYTTFRALSVLSDLNLMNQCTPENHTEWIKSLQYPDGFFKSPQSKRPPWQDTYYAVKSLDLLQSSLEPAKASACQILCIHHLNTALEHFNKPEIVFFTYATLSILGCAEESLIDQIEQWIETALEKILLTNISLNYENVHYTLMIYDFFPIQSDKTASSIQLLSERIKLALGSELAVI